MKKLSFEDCILHFIYAQNPRHCACSLSLCIDNHPLLSLFYVQSRNLITTKIGKSLPKFALRLAVSVYFKITIAHGQICHNS